MFQSISNNSSQGLGAISNVARNARALPMLANIEFESKKRYCSVNPRIKQNDGQVRLKNGQGIKRLNMLEAISKIDEISQSQNDATIGPTPDTERSQI